MKIGYIIKYDLKDNSKNSPRFKFREAHFTRKITSHRDRIYSKILSIPIDYDEIVSNAEIMKKNPNLILVSEPFLLDDELRDKVTRWVDWTNMADPKDYDPFADKEDGNE